MKKVYIALLVASAVISAFVLSSCNTDLPPEAVPVDVTGLPLEAVTVDVTGLSLNTTETGILMGRDLQLTVDIQPDNASNKNIVWISSNSDIATVSDTGIINGIEPGTATITAKTEDGGYCAVCEILVPRLRAPEGSTEQWFGRSLSISGDYAIVGATANGGADYCLSSSAYNTDEYVPGSAYIYYRNKGGDSKWEQHIKLTVDGIELGDYFGRAVSVANDYAVVGAPGDNNNSGSVFIFYRNQGGDDNWGLTAQLTGESWFGSTVSISNGYVVVGACSVDVNIPSNNSAYIYHKDQGGTDNWGQITEIVSAYSNGFYGCSVSISGDYAVVGGSDADRDGQPGFAYLFYRNEGGPDNWGEVMKFISEDGSDGNMVGKSVSISGDYIIAGAPGNDNSGIFNSGSAYIFSRNSPYDTGQIAKLTASDPSEGDCFGQSVAISGDYAVVGAPGCDIGGAEDSGAVYVFYRNEGGTDNWGQIEKRTLSAPVQNDLFGSAVSISGGSIMAGAFDYDNDFYYSGSAYLFSIY